MVSGDLAALCVEIVIPKSKPFLIASWYRSPNTRVYEPQNQLEKVEQMIKNFENEGKEYILIGDLNCDFLNEDGNTQIDKVKSVINDYQIAQITRELTRSTNNSETLLDVVLTNKSKNIMDSGVIAYI